jgi:GTPase involved in cell partitioning and DNA repair
MQNLREKTKSVRKTFTLPKYIAEGLEEYSKKTNTKQSQIVSNFLDELLSSQAIKESVARKKQESIKQLVGCANGLLTDVDKKILEQ